MNVEKIVVYFFGFFLALLLVGTSTGRRAVVSNFGERTSDYRGIQEAIRSGEAELAITGQRIEDASYEIERESGELAAAIGELESAIAARAGSEPEIDALLQRIRDRRVPDDFAERYVHRNTGIEE
jgi:hypothetical protein